VNSALKSCIGNSESDFHVTHIRDRVFRFTVISKAFGFLVYNLRSFSCPSFICHFHLSGFGGPNWVHEHSLWLAEKESSWQTTSRRNPPLTGANVLLVASRSFADVARSTHLDPISSDRVPSPRPDPALAACSNSIRGSSPTFDHSTHLDVAHPTHEPICGKCLALGHIRSECHFDFHCKSCHDYGHIQKELHFQATEKIIFRIKRKSPKSPHVIPMPIHLPRCFPLHRLLHQKT
jgi:hypothetical protein